MPPLLRQSPEAQGRESAHADARQEAEADFGREKRRMLWQCVALSFAGVPLFGLSIYLSDGRQADVALAAALFVSYAGPYFRWLAFHLHSASRDS